MKNSAMLIKNLEKGPGKITTHTSIRDQPGPRQKSKRKITASFRDELPVLLPASRPVSNLHDKLDYVPGLLVLAKQGTLKLHS